MNTTLSFSPQPLSIEFSFQAHQMPKRNSTGAEGLACFTLRVGSQAYGPYLTAFHTTQTAWLTRKASVLTADARLIDKQVKQLNKNLWDAWKTFPAKHSAITGEMILSRAGLKVFSVATGGALYVI